MKTWRLVVTATNLKTAFFYYYLFIYFPPNATNTCVSPRSWCDHTWQVDTVFMGVDWKSGAKSDGAAYKVATQK